MAHADLIRIWDLPVRLFHWLLVSCVTATAITGYLLPVTWLQAHVISGAIIGGLLLYRLVWGFTGSRYSRFNSFLFSPRQVMAHVRDIGHGKVHRDPGHNPLGSLMVFALLFSLTGLVFSGAIVLGGMFKQGPLKPYFSFDMANGVREIHELLAFLLLGLVAAHLAGVVFASWREKDNLALAMMTGFKRDDFGPLEPVVTQHRGIGLMLIAAISVVGLAGFQWAMAQPAFGVHPITRDPVWDNECSACHISFHPSLLPAASWTALMDDLPHHFGEDASLDASSTSTIRTFLTANAAETQDTLAANRFRKVDSAHPFTITAAPFWTRMHGDIPEQIFAAKSIGAKQNCTGCHTDAKDGLFAPQNIEIPKEK